MMLPADPEQLNYHFPGSLCLDRILGSEVPHAFNVSDPG